MKLLWEIMKQTFFLSLMSLFMVGRSKKLFLAMSLIAAAMSIPIQPNTCSWAVTTANEISARSFTDMKPRNASFKSSDDPSQDYSSLDWDIKG